MAGVFANFSAGVGVFADFSAGVHNSVPDVRDLGTPTQFDGVQRSGAAVMTYDSSVVLAPLTRAVKLTSDGSGVAYLAFDCDADYTTHGRIYVRLSATPAQAVRVVRWLVGGSTTAALRINTNGTVSILDSAGVVGGSSFALALGTYYRLEWSVTRGTSGLVTVDIYEEHSDTSLETVASSPFDTGTRVDRTECGSINNNNLGSAAVYISGFADMCRSQPGVYTGPPPHAWEVRDSAGGLFAAVTHDGDFVVFAREIGLLNSARYIIKPGDEVFRIDKYGNQIWGPGRNAVKGDPGHGDSMFAGFDMSSGRAHDASHNIDTINDPPDITMSRAESLSPERSGTDGSVDDSTFTSPTANFSSIDQQRVITVAGVDYYIRSMADTMTATLEDRNAQLVDLEPAGPELPWSMPAYPFPKIISGGKGAQGQWRINPFTFPFIRSGTDGVSDNTTTFTSATAAFTSADVGRYIMIAEDHSRVYEILAVDEQQSSVTLSAVDPVIEPGGQPWSISGNALDSASRAQFNPGTLGFAASDGVRQWNSAGTKATAVVDFVVSLAKFGEFYSGGQGTPDALAVRGADGDVEVSRGDLEVRTAGKGLKVKEGTNAKMGGASLIAGTVTVNTTAVTANSRILLTKNSGSSTGSLRVSARTPGTSFTIASSDAADTGTVAWMIVEPV